MEKKEIHEFVDRLHDERAHLVMIDAGEGKTLVSAKGSWQELLTMLCTFMDENEDNADLVREAARVYKNLKKEGYGNKYD